MLEIIGDYFNKNSDNCFNIRKYYSFVMEKSLALLSKLPGFNDLDSIQKGYYWHKLKTLLKMIYPVTFLIKYL